MALPRRTQSENQPTTPVTPPTAPQSDAAPQARPVDLTSVFGAGAPGQPVEAYTRKTQVLFKPSQYQRIEEEVAARGLPRHGGPSVLIRQIIADALGFQP